LLPAIEYYKTLIQTLLPLIEKKEIQVSAQFHQLVKESLRIRKILGNSIHVAMLTKQKACLEISRCTASNTSAR
jgi:hypothetical protein